LVCSYFVTQTATYGYQTQQQGRTPSRLRFMRQAFRAVIALDWIWWGVLGFVTKTGAASTNTAVVCAGFPFQQRFSRTFWQAQRVDDMASTGDARHHPSALRNRDVIAAELVKWVGQQEGGGGMLEIASGTGEVFFFESTLRRSCAVRRVAGVYQRLQLIIKGSPALVAAYLSSPPAAGCHAETFAKALPAWTFQPTEASNWYYFGTSGRPFCSKRRSLARQTSLHAKLLVTSSTSSIPPPFPIIPPLRAPFSIIVYFILKNHTQYDEARLPDIAATIHEGSYGNIRPPVALDVCSDPVTWPRPKTGGADGPGLWDAVVCSNMIHISPEVRSDDRCVCVHMGW